MHQMQIFFYFLVALNVRLMGVRVSEVVGWVVELVNWGGGGGGLI